MLRISFISALGSMLCGAAAAATSPHWAMSLTIIYVGGTVLFAALWVANRTFTAIHHPSRTLLRVMKRTA